MDKLREQFGSDYRSDLDLIFANPDGIAIEARPTLSLQQFRPDAGD
jgi:hypothetical protein